jgi:hypothetical protein
MSLEQANLRWTEFLSKDGAPPLVGLAPLNETERAQIASESIAFLGSNFSRWKRLFEVYPASTFVWLGCAASSAYSEGTFWSNFEKETGLVGVFSSPNSRKSLVERCRRVARSFKMPLPQDLDGTFSLVSSLLFFGGFPACHSTAFAKEVLAIQKNNELPDFDSEDAGEELCELLGWRLRNLALPTLKRALGGPAGPIVCEAALSVLYSGDFDQINPSIGKALESAFENSHLSRSGASFRSPYLRLSSDLLSLELVCPAQETTLVKDSMIRWIIDGRPNMYSAREDFIVPVTPGKTSCVVEAAGLVSEKAIVREIPLPHNSSQAWLFSDTTRKLKKFFELSKQSESIPCGDYHILYSASNTWQDNPYFWGAFSDSWLVRSIDCRPSKTFSLSDGSITIKAAYSPSIWADGKCLVSGEGHRVHYGKTSLTIWWPVGESINHVDWKIELQSEDKIVSIQIDNITISDNGLYACIEINEAVIEMLPLGVSIFQASLINGSKRKAARDILFWKGLLDYVEQPQLFHTSEEPGNLEKSKSFGFKLGTQIKPQKSELPFRRLTFRQPAGQILSLSWRNSGTFLEAFDREPGMPAQTTPYKLGSTFVASLDSRKFLRIWSDEGFDHLAINGQLEERFGRGGCLELSLAELSTRYPQGGAVTLGGVNVAGFSSPLTPLRVSRLSSDVSRGLDFVLREKVAGVRIVAMEMVAHSNENGHIEWFGESDSVEISLKELPRIRLTRKDGEKPGEYHVAIEAPLEGWPTGLWLLFLEVCRKPSDQPELIIFSKGQKSPLLIFSQPKEGDEMASALMSALAKTWRKTVSGNAAVEGLDISEHTNAVLEILDFLRGWNRFFESGFSGGIDKDFEWIKLLEKALAQLGEKNIRDGNTEGGRWLLSLANTHSGRRRLQRTPEVLCLSASEYSDLPKGDVLLGALAQLNWLSGYHLGCDAVRDAPSKFSTDFLKCFANYNSIANGDLNEFSGFNLDSFWNTLNQGGYANEVIEPQEQLLGIEHWKWSVSKLRERYIKTANSKDAAWGYAMRCLMNGSDPTLGYLKRVSNGKMVLPKEVWLKPSPILPYGNAAMEVTPRFCSTWALANRMVANGTLEFKNIYQIMSNTAGSESNTRSGIRVLLEACPELFGFFLLFWEFQIKIHPYQ